MTSALHLVEDPKPSEVFPGLEWKPGEFGSWFCHIGELRLCIEELVRNPFEDGPVQYRGFSGIPGYSYKGRSPFSPPGTKAECVDWIRKKLLACRDELNRVAPPEDKRKEHQSEEK